MSKFNIMKKSIAKKILNGSIEYTIYAYENELFISSRNNEHGYSSSERISVTAIENCLENIIYSKAFTHLFKKKSTNNAPFLTAILLAENLIEPIGRNIYSSTGNWQEWRNNLLS
jgi:hypothetical protein